MYRWFRESLAMTPVLDRVKLLTVIVVFVLLAWMRLHSLFHGGPSRYTPDDLRHDDYYERYFWGWR